MINRATVIHKFDWRWNISKVGSFSFTTPTRDENCALDCNKSENSSQSNVAFASFCFRYFFSRVAKFLSKFLKITDHSIFAWTDLKWNFFNFFPISLAQLPYVCIYIQGFIWLAMQHFGRIPIHLLTSNYGNAPLIMFREC